MQEHVEWGWTTLMHFISQVKTMHLWSEMLVSIDSNRHEGTFTPRVKIRYAHGYVLSTNVLFKIKGCRDVLKHPHECLRSHQYEY